jgi:antimicrobial peptide system SdpA family protein
VAASRAHGWPHLLTFSRRSKLSGVEIGLLLSSLAEPNWQTCRGSPEGCLEGAPARGSIENALPSPTLCGEVGIVAQPPVPWAWSRSSGRTVMPSQVLRLEVVCHD